MLKTREYYELLNSMGFADLEPIPDDQIKALLDKVDRGGKFPPDVCNTGSRYERYAEKNFSDEEFKRLGLLKLLNEIKTIKNCAIFFVALTVISLILSIVALLL